MDNLDPVLILTGPTAVGKSSLSLGLAEAVGAEIVSADSRQIYRGLIVGTATPPPASRERVPHHLIDCVDPMATYSVGDYWLDVNHAIADVQSRACPAVIVGGSTLYIESLVRGLADLPDVPRGVVEGVASEAATPEGRARLHEELAGVDLDAASTLDPSKSQRLIRLVSLLRATGRPPSMLWREGHRPPVPHQLVVLDRPRDQLYARIERRVDAMLEAGWVEEVRDLLDRTPPPRPLINATIGYREIAAFLDGESSFEDAIRLIKRNTRRYAKRQLTWFRRYDEAVWLDARTASVDSVLKAVAPWPSRT